MTLGREECLGLHQIYQWKGLSVNKNKKIQYMAGLAGPWHKGGAGLFPEIVLTKRAGAIY